MPETKPTFSLYEVNPRRAARGAEAVRMEVFNPGGSIELLWMSERDVRRNIMAFGPCAELDKALAAYQQLRYGARVLAAFDDLTHADTRQREERRAEVERKARENF